MQKTKVSLVGLFFFLAVGVTLATNAAGNNQSTPCSTLPNGAGTIGNTSGFNCTGGTITCCYRLTDNFVFRKPL